MSQIIRVENLSRKFQQKTVVDDLNLSVDEGEIFGFLGHNGAGKTTTVSMLTTLLEPSSGDAWIDGHSVRNQSIEVRRNLGYLPEQVELYRDLTVYENLLFFGRLSGVRNLKNRIDEVLHLLDFSQWAGMSVRLLSKGMRQKAGIAQAILHEPRVLFLDEPVSGLDPQGAQDMRRLLTHLNTRCGTTIFMNTHMLSEVDKVCTSIGILRNGRLIVSGKIDDVLSRFPGNANLEQMYISVMEAGGVA